MEKTQLFWHAQAEILGMMNLKKNAIYVFLFYVLANTLLIFSSRTSL